MSIDAENDLAGLISKQESFDKEAELETSALNKLYIARSEYSAAAKTNDANREELLSRRERSDKELEEINAAIAALDKEKEEVTNGKALLAEKHTDAENRLSGLVKLSSSKEEKLSLADKELSDATLRIKELEQKLGFLNGLENSMEGMSGAVRMILRAKRQGSLRGILGTVSQNISVDGKYSAAIETALGGALQNIITENEDAAKEAIGYLKDNRGGRATFLPVTSVRGNRLSENLNGADGFIALACDLVTYDSEYTGIVNSLLGRIAVFENLDKATVTAKKCGYRFKSVTLDGQVINAGGSFTGGSLSRSSGVLSRKNEITRLTEEKNKLSDGLVRMRRNRDMLKAEFDKLKFDCEAIKEKLSIISGDEVRFEAEEKRIIEVRAQKAAQADGIIGETKTVGQKLAALEESKADALSKLEQTENLIAEAEKSAGERSGKKKLITEKREELSAKLSEYKIAEAELSKDIESISDAIKRIEEQRRSIGDDTARLAVLEAQQKEKIEEKYREIEQLKKNISSSKDVISALNSDISDVQSVSREKEAESTALRRKSRELSDSKEKLASELTRLEERRDSLRNDCDEIIRSLEEQYSLYLSEAQKLALPAEEVPGARGELDSVKQKIRALGSVNVAAVEEYKEVSEQYGFMSGQLEDVTSSKKKLENIIAELTETMKARFSESFNMINENFKRIFTELFGGGKAELVLSDPENVLTSGIEINVAPPGKVIKNLSLLSGGEQSFVAIALYFAILNIRPAPFCILDEIEAALDDVNVAKYAHYLRNYTSTTQFIAITHRRGTMEEADILYGVTMQQKGVSRLIRLEQTPAEVSV